MLQILLEHLARLGGTSHCDGLSYGGIVCALGIHVPTLYRWIGDPKNRLRRERDRVRERNSRLCRKYGLKGRRERKG